MQPLNFLKKIFTKVKEPEPGSLVEEQWTAKLENEAGGRFKAAQAAHYEAGYADGRLELRLHRKNLYAWTEASRYSEADLVLDGEFSFLNNPAYMSAGFLFRMNDDDNFYSVLVSSRGFFRMDVNFNGNPRPLIGWTECPHALGSEFSLRVIARGSEFIIMIDDEWAAETEDASFGSGYIAFGVQNYDGGAEAAAALSSCFLESRPVEVETWFYRYNYYELCAPEARFRLAGTFFSMGEWLKAAVQIRKIEKRRPLSADELFMKAECALRLEDLEGADEALDACLRLEPGKENAVQEKANLLYLEGYYPELREYAAALLGKDAGNARLWNLEGHACFNLGDFKEAAADYSRAAALDPAEPLYPMNAGRAWDQLGAGNRENAKASYLAAARGFYEAADDDDLALALGRLRDLAADEPALDILEAKVLFRGGERGRAEELMKSLIQRKSADASIYYLLGLIEAESGRRVDALPHFEKAAELEPDYPLYAFRAAESLFILERPEAHAAIARALSLNAEDGWTQNLAGMEFLRRGQSLEARGLPAGADLIVEAESHFKAAIAALPDEAEPKINLAELLSLGGRTDEALEVLVPLDTDARARNEAGNVLTRAGRFEEAAKEYEKASALTPGVEEYETNLASVYLELDRYGDAEERIRKALDSGGSARTYLIAGDLGMAFGDRIRAEAAYRVGLESAPEDSALLMALGRCYLAGNEKQKAAGCADSLEKLGDPRAAKLRAEILDATTELLRCAGCGRTWRVPKEIPAQSGESIRAMPPDESPAGICPRCGRIYCIGCRKNDLVDNRFVCPECGETLKLSDNRLRYLVREYLKGGHS